MTNRIRGIHIPVLYITVRQEHINVVNTCGRITWNNLIFLSILAMQIDDNKNMNDTVVDTIDVVAENMAWRYKSIVRKFGMYKYSTVKDNGKVIQKAVNNVFCSLS